MISDDEDIRDIERFRIEIGLNVDKIYRFYRFYLEADDVFFDDVYKMMNELFDDCIKNINDNLKAYHEGEKDVHDIFQKLAKDINKQEN